MGKLKQVLKKFLGKTVIASYHRTLALLANWFYGRPSEKMIIIGVTGTNGKSTTVNLIAKILTEAGYKAALTSTVNFLIDGQDELNQLKMTMPGRFFLQRFLAQAYKAGCTHAVLETSSEGIAQSRHLGIHYDVAVFTNLTPEHLEAHGGFENYKRAKLFLFQHLQDQPHKDLNGRKIKKVIVVNLDDPAAGEFSNFKVDKIVSFGQSPQASIRGQNLQMRPDGIKFKVTDQEFSLKLLGQFDFYNSLAAIATATALDVPLKVCRQALEKTGAIPGRMEVLNAANFKVLIDYAPEPESLRQMYRSIKTWPKQRIIHILGSTGGGRDRSRRKVLGQLAGNNSDIVIVTNEDPYDDDPMEIIDEVAAGAETAGKVLKQTLFKELDRRAAIKLAFNLAQTGDLVVITGKGSEQKMAVKGGYIPWDDRKVASEELKLLSH